MINSETIKEFQEAFEADFGILLSEEEAIEILPNLVAYLDLLAKIDHRKDIQTS